MSTEANQPEGAAPVSDQPIIEHNHPPMVTCPPECPVVAPAGVPEDAPTGTDPAESGTATPESGTPEAEAVTEAPKANTAKKAAKKVPARRRGPNRSSGKPAATEEGEKSADEVTAPTEEAVVDVEREEWFRSPGFQRMKTAWEGEDKRQMDRVQTVIDQTVFEIFKDAYAVMSDLYDIVREPMVTEGGEIVLDPAGFVQWARNPLTNAYIEDWSTLTTRQREDFLFRITTNLFDWEQRSADLWTKAMFSKGMFVERFAIQYDAPLAGTIDDRNAKGNAEAAEERYFALMNSAVSRKAEALVRSMTNLMLRLKDVLSQ